MRPSVQGGNIHAYPGSSAIVVPSWEWLLERVLRREILTGFVGKDGEAVRRALAARKAAYRLRARSSYVQMAREADGAGMGAGTSPVVRHRETSLWDYARLPDGSVSYRNGRPEYGYASYATEIPWTGLAARTVALARGELFCAPGSRVPSASIEGSAVLGSSCSGETHGSGSAAAYGIDAGRWSCRSSIGIVPMRGDALPFVRFVCSRRVYDRPVSFGLDAWNGTGHSRLTARVYPVPDPKPFDSADAEIMEGLGTSYGPVTYALPPLPWPSPPRSVRLVPDAGCVRDVVPGLPACLGAAPCLSAVNVRWMYGPGVVSGPPWLLDDGLSTYDPRLFYGVPSAWWRLAGVLTDDPPVSRRPRALMKTAGSGSSFGSADPGVSGNFRGSVAPYSIMSTGDFPGLWTWLSVNPDWDGEPTYWASAGFPHAGDCACGPLARFQLAAFGHAQPSVPSRSRPAAMTGPRTAEPFFPSALERASRGDTVSKVIVDGARYASGFRHRFCASEPAEISRYLDHLTVTVHRVPALSFRLRGSGELTRETVTRTGWEYHGGGGGSGAGRSSAVHRTSVVVEGFRHYVSGESLLLSLSDCIPLRFPRESLDLELAESSGYTGATYGRYEDSETETATTISASREMTYSDVTLLGSGAGSRPGRPESWTRTRTAWSETTESPSGTSVQSGSDTHEDGTPSAAADDGSGSMLAGVADWIESAEAFLVAESVVEDRTIEYDRTFHEEIDYTEDVGGAADAARTTRGRGTATLRRRIAAFGLGPVDPATGRISGDLTAGRLAAGVLGSSGPATGRFETDSTDRTVSSGGPGGYTEHTTQDRAESSSESVHHAAWRAPAVYVMVAWRFDTESPPAASADPDGLSALAAAISSHLRSARSAVSDISARVAFVRAECDGITARLAGYAAVVSGEDPSDMARELRLELADAEADLQEAEADLQEAEADLQEAVAEEVAARERAEAVLAEGDEAAYEAACAARIAASDRLSSAVADRASAEAGLAAARTSARDAQALVDELSGMIRDSEAAEEQALADVEYKLDLAAMAVARATGPLMQILVECVGPAAAGLAPEAGSGDGCLTDEIAAAEDELARLSGSSGAEAVASARSLLQTASGLAERAAGLKARVAVEETGPTSLSEARRAENEARVAVVAWQTARAQAPS